MSRSFRPTLESLEDRCLLSASAMLSPGMQVALDLQHLQLHMQILVNQAETSFLQADLRLDQKTLATLQGLAGKNAMFAQLSTQLNNHIMSDEAALQQLQLQGMQLAQLDTAQDANTFPLLRAAFPGMG